MSEGLKDTISAALAKACEFEGQLMVAGQAVRERSKLAYGSHLLDARLCLMAALSRSIDAKNVVPGKTDESTHHRLVLLATFIQGIPITEMLISEGQYAKAAAVLKQDCEILARIGEVENGVALDGKTPNAKFAPEGSQPIYGDLNQVAHPSNLKPLHALLDGLQSGEMYGLSPMPVFRESIARQLYEVHVFTLLHAVRENLKLLFEMYPEELSTFEPSIQLFLKAVDFLKRAGFVVE